MNSSQTTKEFVLLQLIPLKPFLLMSLPLGHYISEHNYIAVRIPIYKRETFSKPTALRSPFHQTSNLIDACSMWVLFKVLTEKECRETSPISKLQKEKRGTLMRRERMSDQRKRNLFDSNNPTQLHFAVKKSKIFTPKFTIHAKPSFQTELESSQLNPNELTSMLWLWLK